MKLIEYRIQYSGVLEPDATTTGDPGEEIVKIRCRNINSGYAQALKRALEPLGNGKRREIGAIEFWQVVEF